MDHVFTTMPLPYFLNANDFYIRMPLIIAAPNTQSCPVDFTKTTSHRAQLAEDVHIRFDCKDCNHFLTQVNKKSNSVLGRITALKKECILHKQACVSLVEVCMDCKYLQHSANAIVSKIDPANKSHFNSAIL